MSLKPIYTQETNCRDCYKCIRECPAKAIKVTDHKASIIDDLCIYCGHCVEICPNGAKQIRDGVAHAKYLIKAGKKVIVSLAPSYKIEFPNLANSQLTNALKSLGFTEVSETAHGATVVTQQTLTYLKGRDEGTYISSACPSVVEMIRKYYPQHTLTITPFMSPMLTHAKLLKNWLGKEAEVVFIGPCIAKKSEGDERPDLISSAITFKELKNWFTQSGITPEAQPTEDTKTFYPFTATDGFLYPIDGGMVQSIKKKDNTTRVACLSFSGNKQVRDVLDNLDQLPKQTPLFLELLACEGGCTNGPGTCNKGNLPLKRLQIQNQLPKNKTTAKLPPINIERDFFTIQPVKIKPVSEQELEEALQSIGKYHHSEELNCSGCGYDSCKDFARALLQEKAEPEMCVSYMRKVAHNQAAILLQKIPSGVIIVDNQLKVVEMNKSCAKMLGQDIELIFESNPGLKGANIEKLGFFAEYIKTALATGKEYKTVPINENNKNFQLSIFNIQKHKLITGIIQTTHNPEFRKEIIENRTREVIKKNMETVQKIATLLGESASYTDSLLNSILDDHSEKKNTQTGRFTKA